MNVMFTGPRPRKLGGFAEHNNLVADVVKGWLAAAIQEVEAKLHPEWWITGGAQGFDTWAAESVQAAHLPHLLAIPFEGQDARWPWPARDRYAGIRSRAQQVVVVSQLPPDASYGQVAGALQERNCWMIDRCPGGLCLACWDGTAGGTANCLRAARRAKLQVDCLDLSRQDGRRTFVQQEFFPDEGWWVDHLDPEEGG